jgi:hypothetical protein
VQAHVAVERVAEIGPEGRRRLLVGDQLLFGGGGEALEVAQPDARRGARVETGQLDPVEAVAGYDGLEQAAQLALLDRGDRPPGRGAERGATPG